MRIYKDIPQHLETGEANPEWLSLRAGLFTGSDFNQYLGILGKGLSDTAQTGLARKVCESLGYQFDSFKTPLMERGIELESKARDMYYFETCNDVQEVAFVDWEQSRAGCSPDGVIYDDDGNIEGITEFKCPDIVAYLKASDGYIKPEYRTQIQFNMLITGAKWCDYVVFFPGMKLVINRVEPDQEAQQQIVVALTMLNEKYDELLEKVKHLQKEEV